MAHVEYPQALVDEVRKLGVQLGTGEDYDPSEALETLGQEVQAITNANVHGDVSSIRIAGDADFGGFSLKKIGRGIGKIAKGAAKGVGKVVNNKVFQYAVPGVAAMAGKGPMVELGKKFAPKPLQKGLSIGAKVNAKLFDAATGSGKKKLTPQNVIRSVAKTVSAKGVTSFGIPASGNIKASMAAADRLLGDRNVNNAAAVVRNTKALAALGDANAKRGLAVLNAVATVRTVKKAPAGKAVVPKTTVKTPVVQRTSVAKVNTLAKATVAKKQADKKNQTWVAKVLGWFGLEVKK